MCEKRILSDTLHYLYKIYCQEGLINNNSRATFFRSSALWIISEWTTDRDTTICKAHANFDPLVAKLPDYSIIYLLVIQKQSKNSNVMLKIKALCIMNALHARKLTMPGFLLILNMNNKHLFDTWH